MAAGEQLMMHPLRADGTVADLAGVAERADAQGREVRPAAAEDRPSRSRSSIRQE